MIRFVLRTLWRLVVLLLGVGLAYFAVFVAFPYLDQRLPVFFALLLIYVMVAYFGIPTLWRGLRVFIRPDHIPLYVTTRDGLPSDPVNIAVVARSRHHFIRAMKKAGWYTADKATLRNALREAYAIAFNKPYPNAPFSHLYLFNRSFDIGFQIPYGENGSPRHRHHVRFWQLLDRRQDHGHFRFWIRHFRKFIGREKTVWIGAAMDDISPYGVRWFNLQITHRTHSKHHIERDLIISSLQKAGQVKEVSEVRAGEAFAIRSQQIGNTFISDGKLKITELKEYDSTNFGVGLKYPSDWTLNDTADSLTITSPVALLPNAAGQDKSGAVIVTIRHKQTALAEFKAGNATAVLDSKNVTYSAPAEGQRGTTYLSFVQYASTTTKGALDAIYITGNSGYKKAQAIPQADVIKVDPLINVHFVACDSACTPTSQSTQLNADKFVATQAYTTVETILKSLAFN